MGIFKVGQVVKIVDTGFTYTTFSAIFSQLGFKNKKTNYLNNNLRCKEDPKQVKGYFVIFDITAKPGLIHKDTLLCLRYVTDPKVELLVGAEGVELVKKARW